MFNNIPLTFIPTWKIIVVGLTVFFSICGGLGWSHKHMYDKGIIVGIEAYHAQCLVGGYLIDDKGRAVICGPLSKAPPAEKESYKDKVLAPSLFN